MDIVKAVVAFVVWAFTAQTITAAIVRTLIVVGMNAVATSLAAARAKKGQTEAGGVELARQGGALTRRAVAIGPCVVFGSENWLGASGNHDDNKTNWRVLHCSDWPCRAGRVWVNGQALTFEGDINTGWRACNQYRSKAGQPRVWMRFLTGDWEQTTDTELLATGAFGTDDRLRGCAALLIKREYDADAFPNGPPDANDLRVEVRDAPLYDWRDPDQVLTDVRTWKPSTNPVVVTENLLCLIRAPAQFSPGTTDPIVGPGLRWERRGGRPAFRARLTAMANLCDAVVGGVPRYRVALVVRSDQAGRDFLRLIADACGGEWISGPNGGYLMPGHVPAPCRTMTTVEYQPGNPVTWDPWEAPDQAVNTLQVTGPDLERAGELDSVTVVDDDAVIADGGELAAQLDLSACPWPEQRWRVGWRRYREGRLMDVRRITVKARHMDLLCGDVLLLPDATLPAEVSAAWWQVRGFGEAASTEGHTVTLTVRRVASSIDGPVPEMGATADFDPPPLAPELAVPVIAVVAAPEVAGAAITPRWRITLDEAGVQTRARVMVQGPAATAGAIASATQRLVDVTRGAPAFVPSGPGWWRWRASGLDAAGRQGPWGAWSSAVLETQQVVAGQTAPQPANLLPGGGPLVVPGRPGAGWLGEPGERWQIVESNIALYGLAMWQRDLNGALWDELLSPAMSVTAGETLSALATLGRFGTWSGGDVGVALIFYNSGGAPIGSPSIIGWALDGVEAEPGVYEVKAQGLTAPAGAVTMRFSAGVANGAGSGYAAFWRAKVNRGPVAFPWSDEATTGRLWEARIGENVITPGGDVAVPADILNAFVPRIEGRTSTVVEASFTGEVLSGQLPRSLTVRRFEADTDVSALSSWSLTATGCTATVSGGVVTITAVTATGSITVTSTKDGLALSHQVTVFRNLAAPPVVGGAGAQVAVDTTIEPVFSTSLTTAAGPLVVRAGAAGTISTSAALTYTTTNTGFSQAAGRVRYRALPSGPWVWAGAEVIADFQASGNPLEPEEGFIEVSLTVTGLTSGTDYEWELQLRSTGGVGILSFVGNFAVEAL